ncbi:ATP-binding protein [Massilia polaris]|uniref:ATP-binding protein n=1 Tax=Massilia polaris TaxID=2728846 RepID=UPI001E5DC1FF|nr:ATP-binding protein [Massilia polaris]
MIEAELTAARTADAKRGQAGPAAEPVATLPPQPKTVRETGLELSMLLELAAKAMYSGTRTPLPVLAGKLRLSIGVMREVLDAMVAGQMAEAGWGGDTDLDLQYHLTAAGKQCAAEYLARCRYAGPAPVTLPAYREVCLRQSTRQAGAPRIGAAEMAAAFADDHLDAAVCEQLGASLQSSRSLLLYGPSGSGKSTLARKLGQLQQGLVAVPYAILVDQDIIQFYDPLVHLPPTLAARQGENQRSVDARWSLCQRPVVQVGAELSQEMLDLRFDSANGVYQAPPHLMANGGMLVVDDLGRQRVAPADLLNRWTTPLEAGNDQLTVDGGHKIGVPFDATLVLVTNYAPPRLLDDASMRRVGYKIQVGALTEQNYRALFRHQCRLLRISHDDAVAEHLLTRLHDPAGRPLLASYPRELLGRICDFASFSGIAPRLTIATLEQAWVSMFAGCAHGHASPSLPPAPYNAYGSDPLLERI